LTVIPSDHLNPPVSVRSTLRRSSGLSATAAAGGITAALTQAAPAAALFADLVVNGGFEDVGAISGAYGSLNIASGWAGPAGQTVFAYSYAVGYDDGGPLAGGGDRYFTMNGGDDVEAVQSIDLSSGDTASAIGAGTARYNVSAFFTNYADDLEGGRLTLEFRDLSSVPIGSVTFDDANLDAWSQVGGSGDIPAGTASVQLILGKNPGTGQSSGPDVYADNVAFQVVPEPSGTVLALAGLLVLLAGRRSRRASRS
jgi:MYXO-CTERM domain-containing protein